MTGLRRYQKLSTALVNEKIRAGPDPRHVFALQSTSQGFPDRGGTGFIATPALCGYIPSEDNRRDARGNRAKAYRLTLLSDFVCCCRHSAPAFACEQKMRVSRRQPQSASGGPVALPHRAGSTTQNVVFPEPGSRRPAAYPVRQRRRCGSRRTRRPRHPPDAEAAQTSSSGESLGAEPSLAPAQHAARPASRRESKARRRKRSGTDPPRPYRARASRGSSTTWPDGGGQRRGEQHGLGPSPPGADAVPQGANTAPETAARMRTEPAGRKTRRRMRCDSDAATTEAASAASGFDASDVSSSAVFALAAGAVIVSAS